MVSIMRKHSIFSAAVAVLLAISTIVAAGVTMGGTAFAASSNSSLVWQSPKLIDDQPNPPQPGSIAQISCPTTTFCGMVTTEGVGYTWNGSTWSQPVTLGASFAGVSCPSATFCLAVGDAKVAGVFTDVYAVWNGSAWGTTQPITNLPSFGSQSDNPLALSCASTTFCMAGFNESYVATWNGSTWTFAQLPGFAAAGDPVFSISCPTATFCAAAPDTANESINSPILDTWNGSTWSTYSNSVSGGYGPVSCASATMCVAAYQAQTANETAPAAVWNGATWGSSTNDMPTTSESVGYVAISPVAISCPTDASCLAVSAFSVVSFQDGAWGAKEPLALSGGNTTISCPTTTMCVAGSANGYVSIYQNGSWGAASLVAETPVPPSPGYLSSVSCPTNTFCAAVDGNGNVVTYNGTSWSAPQAIDSAGSLASISCPTSTFCGAIDLQGNLLSLVDGTWNTVALNPNAFGSASISCTGVMTCAVLSGGTEWDATPSAITQVAASGSTAVENAVANANAISCATATWCMLDGASGDVAWTNPVAGTVTPVSAPNLNFDTISCSSTTQCVLGEPYNGQVATWNGTSVSAPVTIDSTNPDITSVSCPSTTDCVAVVSNTTPASSFLRRRPGTPVANARVLEPTPTMGTNGWAISYNGASWGAPVPIDTGLSGNGPQSVSCSTTQCVVVDLTGNEITGTVPPTTCPPLTPVITITGGGGQSAVIDHAFAQPLTASVTCDGKPDTAPVTWTAPSSGASGTVTSTGADTATVVANGTTGTWRVTATVDGVSTTATLTNDALGAASCSASLAIHNGGQVARVGSTFAAPLTVTATCGSAPIPGLSVDVALAPNGGHYITGSTSTVVTTNTAGTATTPTVVAATSPETWVVTAHAVNAPAVLVVNGSDVLPATGVLTATTTLTNAPAPVAPAVVNSGHPGPPTRNVGYIAIGEILCGLASLVPIVSEIKRRKRKAC